jgi:aminopeptidase YwaD
MTTSPPIDVIEGWRVVERLSKDVGARVAGSISERSARNLIIEEFQALELEPAIQPFTFVGWNPGEGATLSCEMPDGSTIKLPAYHLGFTQSTAGLRGRLAPAGTTQLVEGLIEWPRFAIVDDTGTLGYVAVFPDGPSRPFVRPERQHVVSLSTVIVGSDAFADIATVIQAQGIVSACMATNGAYEFGLESANIIVDLPGERSDEVVVVNGHYDTMPDTPGAGDNASGVGGCFAIARRFLSRPRIRSLRIALWGAHEVGLIGSQAYVLDLAEKAKLGSIKAAISLDILSDGDRLGIWTGGSSIDDALRLPICNIPPAYPIETFSRLRGETDSWSFAERGIDTAMFLTLPYSRFHLPEDTIENNDPGLFRFSVEVADHLVQRLVNTH